MTRAPRAAWLLVHLLITSSGLSIDRSTQSHLILSNQSFQAAIITTTSRRQFVASAIIGTLPLTAAAGTAVAAYSDPRSTIVMRLESIDEKAGLKLVDVTIGSPPRTAVAVDQVLPGGVASRCAGVQPGVLLTEYSSAKTVIERLRSGPYPVELKFYNLAAGGDAFGDMGKPLVTARDALDLAKSSSSSVVADESASSRDQQEYVMRVLKKSSASSIQSRRGDVLEVNYEARFGGADGPVYDTSSQRGTGQPYQFVLGSGDMIPGVDRGMYDMSPGEIRLLEIPPALGYGPRASKNFGIPMGRKLFWKVELVAVNSVREGDDRTRDELEGRVL